MAEEPIDNGDEDPDEEPLTFLELLDALMRSKGSREWLGDRADLWFKERRQRIALERQQDMRRYKFARLQMWAGVALALTVLGCLTALVGTASIPKDAALPLFGAIVGAIFAKGRAPHDDAPGLDSRG